MEPYWAPDQWVETFLQSGSIPPRYKHFLKSDLSVTNRGVSLAGVQHTGQSVLAVCNTPDSQLKIITTKSARCVTHREVSLAGV